MPAAPEQDATLKGRQVVFVKPHSVVQNELLAELIRNEYAVAVLNDHTKVRELFRTFPEGITFLNIDEGYTEAEWEALVRGAEDDPATAQARIGIVTYNTDPELSRKYLLELMVSCGFIKLSLELAESTKTILKVLDANEAKGRRQYIRVLCSKGSASLNVASDVGSVNGTVIDISSVGLACVFERDPGFKARSLVKNVQLKLTGVLCQVSAIIMGSRTDEEGRMLYVLLFDPRTPDEVREKVRVFLRNSLQFQLDADLGAAN
jgi:hypothetical protein